MATADDQIDLSAADNKGETPTNAAKHAQFKRDLSHLLMEESDPADPKRVPIGPVLTLGKYELTFKPKAPVDALAHLIQGGLEGMRNYVLLCIEGDPSDFLAVQSRIDIDGLGEIITNLGEGYTSFPAKS